MGYTEALISGLVLGLFIALSMGPTLFAVIRYSMHHSYKAGIAFVLGVSISDILYVASANLAAGFMDYLKSHEQQVGYAGAILFTAIGLFALLKKIKPKRPRPAKEIKISNVTYLKIWLTGFLMNALNPMAILLWIGAAIKASSYNVTGKFIFFGACLGLVLSGDIAKVFLADKLRTWLTPRRVIYINRISAFLIFIFGVGLLISLYFHLPLGGGNSNANHFL